MGSDPQSYLLAMDELAHRECREVIASLQQQLEMAANMLAIERAEQADVARLDWLEKNGWTVVPMPEGVRSDRALDTLRATIDAAMAEEKER